MNLNGVFPVEVFDGLRDRANLGGIPSFWPAVNPITALFSRDGFDNGSPFDRNAVLVVSGSFFCKSISDFV